MSDEDEIDATISEVGQAFARLDRFHQIMVLAFLCGILRDSVKERQSLLYEWLDNAEGIMTQTARFFSDASWWK